MQHFLYLRIEEAHFIEIFLLKIASLFGFIDFLNSAFINQNDVNNLEFDCISIVKLIQNFSSTMLLWTVNIFKYVH